LHPCFARVLSRAFDYAPHDAKELRESDSVGYELMTKAYGTPEQIEEAKKKAREKKKK
jgi:hypothetical protein